MFRLDTSYREQISFVKQILNTDQDETKEIDFQINVSWRRIHHNSEFQVELFQEEFHQKFRNLATENEILQNIFIREFLIKPTSISDNYFMRDYFNDLIIDLSKFSFEL